MKAFGWVFLIIIIIIGVLLTINYYKQQQSSLEPITSPTSCLTAGEKNNFGFFQNDKFKMYVPKKWESTLIDGTDPIATTSYKINKSDEYEFFSVWSKGYPNNADSLLIDTLKPIKNYKIDSQTTVKNHKGLILTKYVVSFDTDIGKFKQDIAGYVANGKGYLLLLRTKAYDYNVYQTNFEKIICSFEPL